MFFVAILTTHGSDSLWLSVSGAPVTRCAVTEVVPHQHRHNVSYSNRLRCGDRTIDYYPSSGYDTGDVGARVALVVDPAGVFRPVEPGKVSATRNFLLLLAALVASGFAVAVLMTSARRA